MKDAVTQACREKSLRAPDTLALDRLRDISASRSSPGERSMLPILGHAPERSLPLTCGQGHRPGPVLRDLINDRCPSS